MSRGFGRVQRAILHELQAAGRVMAPAQLARAIFGAAPTQSQIVSVRRALRGLADTGDVMSRGSISRKTFWGRVGENEAPAHPANGLRIIPLELRELNAIVEAHHRHHKPVQGHRFSLGVERDGKIVGGCSVGRPVARLVNQRAIAEVTRLVTDGTPNACSALYAAAARTCKEIGFKRIQTYTLATENGASLRGAGWRFDGHVRGKAWTTGGRDRRRDQPEGPKHRWVRDL